MTRKYQMTEEDYDKCEMNLFMLSSILTMLELDRVNPNQDEEDVFHDIYQKNCNSNVISNMARIAQEKVNSLFEIMESCRGVMDNKEMTKDSALKLL